MRTPVNKIIFLLSVYMIEANALDLTNYESTCSEIGFKRKTPAFGECVLELHDRESKKSSSSQKTSKPVSASVTQGDGTPDHATCAKYGFQANTNEYAQCRMQIDTARKQAEEQERQYQEQVAAQARAKEKAQGEALFLFGMGLLSGAQPNAQSSNLPFIQPPRTRHTYTLPNGTMMTCTTKGGFTNCF